MIDISRALFKALWSQLHPYMLLLTLLPFVLAGLLWGALVMFYWEPSVNALQQWLNQSAPATWWTEVLGQTGWAEWSFQWGRFIAPILLGLLALPFIAVTVIALIGWVAAPLAARHVARRHFPGLTPQTGWGIAASAWHALWVTLVFVLLWLISIPLWLIPPLGFVLPLLLWGWLTYRILAFDVLNNYATPDERRWIMDRHRGSLWVLGGLMALLGAAPTLVWIGGMAAFVFMPLMGVMMLWLYVLTLMYSALVFAHYGLAVLSRVRQTAPETPIA